MTQGLMKTEAWFRGPPGMESWITALAFGGRKTILGLWSLGMGGETLREDKLQPQSHSLEQRN